MLRVHLKGLEGNFWSVGPALEPFSGVVKPSGGPGEGLGSHFGSVGPVLGLFWGVVGPSGGLGNRRFRSRGSSERSSDASSGQSACSRTVAVVKAVRIQQTSPRPSRALDPDRAEKYVFRKRRE